MKLTTVSKYLLKFLGTERGQPKGPIFTDAYTLREHILQRLKEMAKDAAWSLTIRGEPIHSQ